jgi:hypothetical protein
MLNTLSSGNPAFTASLAAVQFRLPPWQRSQGIRPRSVFRNADWTVIFS